MNIFEEELLEPIARLFRFRAGVVHITPSKKIILADLGCGPKIRFYHYAKKNGITISKYIGVDPLLDQSVIDDYKKKKDIEFTKGSLEKSLPLQSESVDYVVGFAFLEHIDNPKEILNDAVRVLKPGGKAIFTTPSHKAKSVLEFLSFKLGLISPREIAEHKNYFNFDNLSSLLTKKTKENTTFEHSYFEFGLNNLIVITKKS